MKSSSPIVNIIIGFCAIIALLTFLPSIQAGNIANNVVAATNFLNSFGYWVLGGGSSIPGNIIPSSDNTYDLGSSTAGWRNGYVSSNLTVNGTLYAKTGRAATYVIAASNAPAHVKAQADAVCDGTADNAEFTTAFTAGYKNVLASEGTFYWAALVTTPTGVWLRGSGPRTVFYQPTAANITTGFFYSDTANITYSDFIIDVNGSGQGTGQYAIRSRGSNASFYRLAIKNTYSTTPSINYDAGSDIRIEDCTFSAAGTLTTSTGGAPAVNRVWVQRNTFLNPVCGTTGSVIGGSVYDYHINGNSITNTVEASAAPIDVAATVSADISGNTINGTAGTNAIYADGASGLRIHDNILDKPIWNNNAAGTSYIYRNTGYVTENSGSANITTGLNLVTVTHGLAATPDFVFPSSSSNETGFLSWSANTTSINITSTNNVTANRLVYWRASIGAGN